MDALLRKDLMEVYNSITGATYHRHSRRGIRAKYLVSASEKYWAGEKETLMWGRYEVYFCESGKVERIYDKHFGCDIYNRKDELVIKIAGI